MTTWRGVRKEIVGAWRSVQYDLARARRRGSDGDETTELIFPEHSRPPRRLFATGGFALVSIVGALGTYFAVVNGLGALLEGEPAQAETPASVVAGAARTGQRPQDVRPDRPARIARQGGPLTVAGRQAASGRAGSSDTHDGAPTGVGPAPDLVRGPGDPMPEESPADTPDPQDPTGTPSPTASPTPDEPSPTGEPTPSPTVSPTADDQHYEGRRRHHRHPRHRDENP
ncbi:hypothetical protein [Asanoa sp. NPDC050611]|uniref:hypothetical protein n=1 Tax=Asanoa sp. NPDC050611 TaxID=3157098 RepID=UPI0033DC854A